MKGSGTPIHDRRTHILFFGTSITVTTENILQVTSSEFIDQLRGYGCKIVFFIEYVPTESGTEHLAFGDEHVRLMEDTLEERRQEYEDIIFLSFPGDEKAFGGCLASGRGFFPAKLCSHLCSERFAPPRRSAGSIQAVAHSSSIAKK